MYDWYEIFACPSAPTERGQYIGATPIYEQAENAVTNHNRQTNGAKWFIKGVRSNGERVVLL